eukprot:COSAG01_NODE_14794_length_1409_cov_1.172519_1_plen_218_part_10
MEDVDELMQAAEGFLLGSWLMHARKLGGDNESLADFYEWNARSQITTWKTMESVSGEGGLKGSLHDYARKEWSGMVREYYAGRLKTWLNHTLQTKAWQHAHSSSSSSSGGGRRGRSSSSNDDSNDKANKLATTDHTDADATAPPPLANSLAAFAYHWQHTRWDSHTLPAEPVGDAVVISKRLLAKYQPVTHAHAHRRPRPQPHQPVAASHPTGPPHPA